MLHPATCLQGDQYHFLGITSLAHCRLLLNRLLGHAGGLLSAPLTAWLLMECSTHVADSNSMLQAGPPIWANLPEDLLASVFSALDYPRDLLACACVCKAWRNGKAKVALPVLSLHHTDLEWLSQLTHAQMAAVRDVRMRFLPAHRSQPGCVTASFMLLAFICGRLSMLQQLKLNWENFHDQDHFDEVGCPADA